VVQLVDFANRVPNLAVAGYPVAPACGPRDLIHHLLQHAPVQCAIHRVLGQGHDPWAHPGEQRLMVCGFRTFKLYHDSTDLYRFLIFFLIAQLSCNASVEPMTILASQIQHFGATHPGGLVDLLQCIPEWWLPHQGRGHSIYAAIRAECEEPLQQLSLVLIRHLGKGLRKLPPAADKFLDCLGTILASFFTAVGVVIDRFLVKIAYMRVFLVSPFYYSPFSRSNPLSARPES